MDEKRYMKHRVSEYLHTFDEACDGLGCRPVVVIDPEDREQVERLAQEIFDRRGYTRASLADALREFATPTPPRPEEPTGLGAVVEDASGIPWVRCENVDLEPHWYARNRMGTYADIKAVRVLSEGVVA